MAPVHSAATIHISWNVNGLQRLLGSQSLEAFLDSLCADIVCLQEVKLPKGRIAPALSKLEKYWAFYHLSSTRLGVAGVATFCRKVSATPVSCHLGFILDEYANADQDGRVLVTDHSDFILMNVYFPTGAGSSQLIYKVWFLNVIQETFERLSQEGRDVVMVGDLGFAMGEKDHYSPETSNTDTGMKVYGKHRGRTWLNMLLSPALDLCHDVFRLYHPEETGCFTYWRDAEHREKNEGARVDYVIATKAMAERLMASCELEPQTQGSDHCPIRLKTNIEQTTIPKEPPEQCAAFAEPFDPENAQRILCDYFPIGKPKAGQAAKVKRVIEPVQPPGPAALEADEATTNPGGFVCHHNEPAKITVVKKPGRNQGRPFYMCRRAPGNNKDPDARCDFFQWADTNASAKQCDCQKPAKLAPVKKEGRNHGRLFYSCARKGGKHCNFFMWSDEDKKNR